MRRRTPTVVSRSPITVTSPLPASTRSDRIDAASNERLTVRDSSLSACVQAVMAAEVGHLDLAYDYAYEAALIDMRNLHHNTGDGLHMASLGGAWSALVCGFGGLRDRDGHLSFDPALPIGLPGDDAIDSALHPTAGPWLYFVAVNLKTGETVFSTTISEHNAAVKQWQAWCRASAENMAYCA